MSDMRHSTPPLINVFCIHVNLNSHSRQTPQIKKNCKLKQKNTSKKKTYIYIYLHIKNTWGPFTSNKQINNIYIYIYI